MKYPDPLTTNPELKDLRDNREYSKTLVDEIVNKICDERFLPPGLAMLMFVWIAVGQQPDVRNIRLTLGDKMATKVLSLWRVASEAHPWVTANVLYGLRDRLYEQHHLNYCRGFSARARRYEALKEAEAEHGTTVHEFGLLPGASGGGSPPSDET